MMENWMKNHLLSDNNYNIVIPYCPIFFFNKKWQIMLGLHLVLVTLHGWFTINIEQDEWIDDTKYVI